jgi:thiamine biosynthesis lipoprotein
MGSAIELTSVGVSEAELDRAAGIAFGLAEQWEIRLSRFRPQSELTRLNGAAGEATLVSREFLTVLDAALDGHRRSGGRYDPTVLPALVALGYDRDFAEVRSGSSRGRAGREPSLGLADLIEIDRSAGTVRLPRGCALDFGGIAKGMFVDRLADRFTSWPGGSINAGGDLRVWGIPPEGERWVIGLEDPFAQGQDCSLISVLAPDAAAVATSALNRKVWKVGAEQHHHVIDPRTGRPVRGKLISATAVAGDLRTAEIATKALLVADGRGESLDPVDAAGAVVIDMSGMLLCVPGWNPDAFAIYPLDSQTRSA